MEDEPRYSININVVDRVVWLETISQIQIHKEVEHYTKPVEYDSQISDLTAQADNIKSILSSIEDEEKKAFKMYLKGKVNDTIYEETMQSIKEDKSNYEKEIARINSKITTLKIMQEETNKDSVWNPRSLDNITLQEKKELVDKYIEKVIISKDDRYYYIECIGKLDFDKIPIATAMQKLLYTEYRYSQRGGVMKLECREQEESWYDITNTIDMIYQHKKKG